MYFVTLGTFLMAQVACVRVVVQVLRGGGKVRILPVALQAVFLCEQELREWNKIAFVKRCNDLVEELVYGLRVTGLARDVDELMLVGEILRRLPRVEIRLHDMTPPAVIGTLTDLI
jgi:hypothetical protein